MKNKNIEKKDLNNLEFNLTPVLDSYDRSSNISCSIIKDNGTTENIRNHCSFPAMNLMNFCDSSGATDFDVYALPKDLDILYTSTKFDLETKEYSVEISIPSRLSNQQDTILKNYNDNFKGDLKKPITIVIQPELTEEDLERLYVQDYFGIKELEDLKDSYSKFIKVSEYKKFLSGEKSNDYIKVEETKCIPSMEEVNESIQQSIKEDIIPF